MVISIHCRKIEGVFMMILKHLTERFTEPFRKLDEVFKDSRTGRNNHDLDKDLYGDEEEIVVTRITGLRSMFVDKLSPGMCPPRLRRI